MMITGTALHVESSTHNRTNFVCIYENGKKIACDDAVYNVEEDKEFKSFLNEIRYKANVEQLRKFIDSL